MQSRRAPLAIGLLAATLALSWQALTVHYNYGGNWTALFCTGSKTRMPPEVASENLYIFPETHGYDGQFYHWMAHDPLLERGFPKYFDSAVLRYRRILVPGLAFLLAGGRDDFVHVSYFAVLLGSVFLGAWWLSRYVVAHGWRPVWGLGFLLVPSVIISLDRATVDLTLAAFVAGFALYVEEGPAWKLYLVCVLAVLARETGILLLGGYGLFLLWKRQWLRAVIFATAALPALGWYMFVQLRTADSTVGVAAKYVRAPYPGEAFLHFLSRPQPYHRLSPELAWTAVTLDYLALFGALLAVVLVVRVVVWAFVRRSAGPVELAGLLYALMTILVGAAIGWHEPFGYTRTLSPLFLLLALRTITAASWWSAVPLAMVLPRIGLQLGPQVLGIVRGIF